MDQKTQILNHFAKKKFITSWEAIEKYGITRLADTIFQLKCKGHEIITVNESLNGKRWAKYVYKGLKK